MEENHTKEVIGTSQKTKNNQSATSVKRFEDSPTFNFTINSLSPNNPLTFASIQSPFAPLKNSQVTHRHQLSRPQFSSDDHWNTVKKNKANVDADNKLDDDLEANLGPTAPAPRELFMSNEEYSKIIAELLRYNPEHELEYGTNSYQNSEGNIVMEGVGSIDLVSNSSDLSVNPASNFYMSITHAIQNRLSCGNLFANPREESKTMESNEKLGDIEGVNPKRRRLEQAGEGEVSCRRCNCRKSKCLKLYCECFAAGVYCVEPCACVDCFNKDVHEEIVVSRQMQLESRNPLAFAPKVIRGSCSSSEDDISKTPASARHKRGCNCRKSDCLKKYCECYKVGVGCSVYCRCEGCKNEFGTKDGSCALSVDHKLEEDEGSITEKPELNIWFQKNAI